MTVQDVLAVEPRGRLPWGPLATGGVLLLALIGVALVLPEGPPGPLAVDVLELDGSALLGEAFVRLNLSVEVEGVQELGEVRLSLAGTSTLGSIPAGLDDDGRGTVQVDLVPPCPLPDGVLVGGTLDLTVVDVNGRTRTVRAPLPEGGPLERLVRYRCRT